VDLHPQPQPLGVVLPRLGQLPLQLQRHRVVLGEEVAHAVRDAPAIHILRAKRHDLRRLRLEDLGELAASLEPLGVRRIVGKAEPLLPFDLHALAGPRLVTLARWPADARAAPAQPPAVARPTRGAPARRPLAAPRPHGALAAGPGARPDAQQRTPVDAP